MPNPAFLRVLPISEGDNQHWGGTSLFLVGDSELTLIDTGNIDRQGSRIVIDYFDKRSPKIFPLQILITHCHRDHVGGLQPLYERWQPKVYAHPLAVEALRERWDFPGAQPLGNNEVVEANGVRLRTMYTPGHSADHLCFWEENTRTLFSGDLVLGKGTAMVTDLVSALVSLRQVLAINPSMLCPGHGPVVPDAARRIRWYIARRLTRERQIVQLLRRKPSNITSLVASIYPKLDPRLFRAAENSILAHLIKLENDGKVYRQSNDGDTIYTSNGKQNQPNLNQPLSS